MPTQKDSIRNLIRILKQWQLVEDLAVKNTNAIIAKTKNPIIKIIMQIIKQDSAMHKKVQQLIIDHFEIAKIGIESDELKELWEMVEEHEHIERKTIEMAQKAIYETTSTLANYFLNYLLTDEKKHDKLLEEINKIKEGVYPYGKLNE